MSKNRMKRRTFGALTAGAVIAGSGLPARAADKVLKFVQNGNMTILDPIWTTAYVTRTHGYFIYDTLFSMDANNEVKPQMVDKYEVSADKTLWTFTLRDGLEWHDGTPVTSEDCIPSIQRWGRRDAMGLKLMDFVAEFKAVNPKTFTMKLKEPYGLVLESLGKPSSNVPFMMPKKVAETDPFKQIDSQMGSGPFVFGERVRGANWTGKRFDKYPNIPTVTEQIPGYEPPPTWAKPVLRPAGVTNTTFVPRPWSVDWTISDAPWPSETIAMTLATPMRTPSIVSQRCAFFLAAYGEPGRIVESGLTEHIFANPDDPRTADYVQGRFG